MNIQAILSHIDAEAIARDVLEMVKVKSETGAEGPGSLFLSDLLKREGFDVRLDEFLPDRPNVLVKIAGNGDGARAAGAGNLVFNGHTDTIPIGSSMPPAREGDWIVGRGTEDMKGGLVAMVHAASALKKAKVRLAGDLWLTGVVGHEIPAGKKEGPRRLIEQLKSREIDADAILIVEGPCAIWSTALGSTFFTITITSELGPIHTIKTTYKQNPAYWLGVLLQEFQQLEEQFSAKPAHPLCGRQQINVGIVHAGDYPNRLPYHITVAGTRRWTPGTTLAQVRAQLQDVCDRIASASGLRLELETQGAREPFETPDDHPIMSAVRAAGRSVTGSTPETIGMGLVGDANLYANDGGVPTVYYGPAHQTAHSDNERVSISQLAHCAKVYALSAVNFCGVVDGPSA